MTRAVAHAHARYRFFVTDDAGLVARLQRTAYRGSGLRPWSAPAVARQLAAPCSVTIVCARRDRHARRPRAIGFALIQIVPPECEILALGIVPAQRRRGAARALLSEIESRSRAAGCDRVFLDVGAGNTAARALYEEAGFDAIERRLGYYGGGDVSNNDALVLTRQIEK